MKKIFKLKTFWAVFVLSAFIFYVAFLNFSKTWESESELLIIPRNKSFILENDRTANNLKGIVGSLYFFEKILEKNPDLIEDEIIELPNYKKKLFWNSKVKVDLVENSDIIKIVVQDKSRFQAGTLNAEVVKMLLETTGVFYNLEKEIGLRVIDKTITKETVVDSKINIFLKGLIIAFLLSTLSFYLSFQINKKIIGRKNINKKKKGKKAWKINPQKITELPAEEEPWTPEKTADAPQNLPVAEEKTKPLIDVDLTQVGTDKESVAREATPEEVKERLNKLLSGGL